MKRKACLLLLVIAVFGLIGWTASGQRQRLPAQTEWEYRIIYVPGARQLSEKALNDLGSEGWELVTFQEVNREGGTIGAGNLYLKRLKQR